MAIPSTLIEQLQSICDPQRVQTDPAQCWVYGNDNSRKHAPPDAVVFPQKHSEVVEIVSACYQQRIPIVPRGRGTGTTGAATAPDGGVMISSEQMDQILNFNATDRSLCAQAGVSNHAIQKHCQPHRLFWPPDPGSAAYCSLGGNIACNAAGPRALKYGATRENILQIKAVSGDAKTIVCGSLTSKSSVGFDLARLLIGSEGTLAVITEATVKLSVLAEQQTSIRIDYASVESAVDAVCVIMGQTHTPCALEFMDDTCVDLLRKYSDQAIHTQTQAVLIVTLDGSQAEVAEAVESVKKAAHNPHLLEWLPAASEDAAQRIWQARKALSPTLRNHKPHKINEDVVVPLSELSGFVRDLRTIAADNQLCIANFGHIGNGNLHVNILYDPEQEPQAQDALDKIFNAVIRRGGSVSGEHGIGLSKLKFAKLEIDENALEKMRQIKKVFDPANILNSGKALP